MNEPVLSPELRSRLDQIIQGHPVVLFMKGTADFPMCGFSGAAVELLSKHGVAFESVNVLADEEIRQGVKVYGDWPTFPQLWVRGELVGGADILRDMDDKGELAGVLQGA